MRVTLGVASKGVHTSPARANHVGVGGHLFIWWLSAEAQTEIS